MHLRKEYGVSNVQKPIKTLVSVAILAVIAANTAEAGSFSLYTESNGSASGNFAAGIAAEAADASTGWYNPAGLALIRKQQAVFGGVGIFPSSKITGTSTYHTPALPNYVQTFNGMDGAENAFVPSFHYARPLGENATVGLSAVSPFGLSTDWSTTGPVRYAATRSQLKTFNISPEIGGIVADHLALGLGIDFQYATVKFNRVIGSPAYITALDGFVNNAPASFLDSTSNNTGDSFGMGFHAGLLLLMNDNHCRIGLNYQSQVNHKFHGTSRLTGRLASPGLNIGSPASILAADPNAVFQTNNLSSNDIDFPEVITLSGYHDINESLALLASVVYTGWDTLKTIQLNNVGAYVTGVGQAPVNSVTPEFYRNTWRAALGANYKVNTKLMLRVGGGYDQTPTVNAYRDIRIADTDRWALSAGAHYQARPNLGLDLGYTHLFPAENVSINKTDAIGTSSYNVNATARGYADLVGIQLTWAIDGVEPSVLTK